MTDVEPRSLSVLLVEDNLGDRRLAEIALREAAADAGIACTVNAADSLAAALRCMHESATPVDAILLDLGLPDAHGLEGLLALRTVALDAAIVVLTGLSDLKTATEALSSGASDYLEKGEIQPRTLLRAVRYSIERRKSAAELVRMAHTDPLTGLLNRRGFFEELERRLRRLERGGRAGVLLYIDMDNFKLVNDRRGHRSGDEAIRALVDLMRSHSRGGDLLARLGGDEFAIWIDGLGERGALARAETLLQASHTLADFTGDPARPLGISIGLALTEPGQSETPEQLVARADAAMYRVKAAGKGGITVAAPAAGIAAT